MKKPAEIIINKMRDHVYEAIQGYNQILVDTDAFNALTDLEREHVKLAVKHLNHADKRLFEVRYRECRPLRGRKGS